MILDELLPRWDIHTDFVEGSNLKEWKDALSTPADAVFFESPSNPMQTLVDVEAVSNLAHEAGAQVIVDNVFATPVLQKPFELGADIVVYSHYEAHRRPWSNTRRRNPRQRGIHI